MEATVVHSKFELVRANGIRQGVGNIDLVYDVRSHVPGLERQTKRIEVAKKAEQGVLRRSSLGKQHRIRWRHSAAEIIEHLGGVLLLQGRYDEATAAFKRAASLSPDSTTPAFGMAQLCLAKGDYDQAMTYFVKQSVKEQDALIDLALLTSLYAARHDDEKALATLRKALEGGYRDFLALDASPYLEQLRKDPRYQQLILQYRK